MTQGPKEKKSRRRVSASPRQRVPVITLLTDFGTADYFVAAMRGVILSANANVQIVDITHEIPPHDIEAGAFTLLSAYRSFPAGTIHVAVVDPGVGSSRRAILIEAGNHLFLGPDNGLFSYICDREPHHRVFYLTNEKYFCKSVSQTFHGRDVFAPVAAALSRGIRPEELGNKIKDPVRLETLALKRLKNGDLQARIIHIDRFGNCITNLCGDLLTPEMIAAGAKLRVKGKTVSSFRRFFADDKEKKGNLFAVWGSAGFLEIAAAKRSAANTLKVKRGDAVIVTKSRL